MILIEGGRMRNYLFNCVILRTIIVTISIMSIFFSVGCSNKESATMEKKITIDSIKDKSNDELAEEVIGYIKEHPENSELIASFIAYTRDKHLKRTIHVEGDSVLLNSVPIVGGAITDYSNSKYVSNYKDDFSKLIEEIPKLRNQSLHQLVQGVVSKHLLEQSDADIFYDLNKMPTSVDIKAYNAMIKTSALMVRELEAVIEESKSRFGIEPDIIDFIDIATYELFSSEENKKIILSCRHSINNICESLNISKEYTKNKNYSLDTLIFKLYNDKIPRHLFPYKLEVSYLPADDGGMKYQTGDSNLRKEICSILNGKWTSLKTGEDEVISVNPLFVGKIGRYPTVGYVECVNIDYNFAVFNFDKSSSSSRIFITPAIYVNENKDKEEVLIMYVDYTILGYNRGNSNEDLLKNYNITRMNMAEDVLIKKKNTAGNYKEKFDLKNFVSTRKNYLMSDKLIISYLPDDKSNYLFLTRTNDSYKKAYSIIGGTWKSLKTGDVKTINMKDVRFNEITCLSKEDNFVIFSNNNGERIFVTPVTYIENGNEKSTLVSYINYKLIENPETDNEVITVYNWRVDNIKEAQDVWIRE